MTWKRSWLDVSGVAAWLRTCLSADVSILCLRLMVANAYKWEQMESWSHRGIKTWAGRHWWWGHLMRERILLQRLITNQWRTTMHNMSTKHYKATFLLWNWGLNSRQHSRMKIYLGLMNQTWPDPTKSFKLCSWLILNHDDSKPGLPHSVTQWIKYELKWTESLHHSSFLLGL